MSRALLLVVVLASLLLAGCAGPGKPTGTTPEGPEIQDGSGRLEGSVVNDAFIGVPGATVKIAGMTESRRTDVEGRFVFANLSPGAHKLRVEASGWLPAEVTANI